MSARCAVSVREHLPFQAAYAFYKPRQVATTYCHPQSIGRSRFALAVEYGGIGSHSVDLQRQKIPHISKYPTPGLSIPAGSILNVRTNSMREW